MTAVDAAPIRIGLLFDFPQQDGGDSIAEAVTLGLEEVAATGRVDRSFVTVRQLVSGLPAGTAHAVEQGFAALVDEGVLAVVGPSISDNGLIANGLADSAGVPTINYTGGERTRSAWMYHYQVGSLEEEPAVIASHLAARGFRRAAVVHDHSPVGRGYAEWFEHARASFGIELSAQAPISPLATDATDVVGRMRRSEPDVLVYLGLGVAARTVSLALAADGWKIPVVANSALMFGYAQRTWREAWDGWVYVDTVADDNRSRQHLAERSRAVAAGPVSVAAYDIGRLLGEAVARSSHLTRAGIKEGLEKVKRLPASSGLEGTTMGFGCYDHAALKGEFLVLREWRGGKTVQLR